MVAWVILIVIAFGFPYSPSYSTAAIASFSAMPWSLLSKGVQDLADATSGAAQQACPLPAGCRGLPLGASPPGIGGLPVGRVAAAVAPHAAGCPPGISIWTLGRHFMSGWHERLDPG